MNLKIEMELQYQKTILKIIRCFYYDGDMIKAAPMNSKSKYKIFYLEIKNLKFEMKLQYQKSILKIIRCFHYDGDSIKAAPMYSVSI